MDGISKMDLGPFVNEHPKLWDFCWKIYSVENFLKNEKFRYLYLANLISSDTIIDEITAQEALDELNFIKQNIFYFNINEEIHKETMQFVNKGIQIVKKELKEFRKQNLLNKD